MRVLILLLILCNSLFAQYDSTMYDLIKTTYERSFETHIVYKYLHSNSEQKTKAAILSIAQSEDTSFVPELLKLDLMRYGGEVCFTLAQIGSCNQSINFLWNYLYTSPPSNQFPKIFFAVGKIGDETDLNKLVDFYNSFDGPIFPYEGVSEAILQFQIKGIKSDDAIAILETEITHLLSSRTRIVKALFTIARYGGSKNLSAEIQKFVNGSSFLDSTAKGNIELKQFVLMNVTNEIVMNSVKTLFDERVLNNTLLKIQFAKILHYLSFDTTLYSKVKVKIYLELLNDENPNVALQTAISIKNIKNNLNNSLRIEVKNRIDSLLFDSTKSLSFKGELFLSRFEIFGGFEEHQTLIGQCPITSKYFMQFYAKNIDNKLALKKLMEYYIFSSAISWQMQALEEIVKIKDEIREGIDYERIILFALNSNSCAPLISIAADGIDSGFIAENINDLKEIIAYQLNTYKDNPDFLEATMSLINLAERIDKDFYTSMTEKVKSSKLYSIRKFISSKTGIKQIGFKELDKFEEIWSYAIKHKQATIKTSKGNVVIEFDSDIAPISVANFCMLAKQNFYNGIIFHRVVPGFVIQAGDPTATGWGGPGYDIVSEFSDTDFGIGYVGMASAGKDTESSQFFIMQGSYPHLDSRYTLFAKVIEGMDVVYNITEDDKIVWIELQ